MSSEVVQRIGLWIFLICVFVLPSIFLPFTAEFYDFTKNTFILSTSVVCLVLLAVGFVIDKQVRITRSPFGLPMLAILVSWLASTVLHSPNRAEALMEPTQMGTVFALVILFFTAVNFIHTRREVELTTLAVISSLGLLGVISIVWSSGLVLAAQSLPLFLNSPIWTPTGNPVATLVALIAGLPLVISLLAREKTLNLRSSLLTTALLSMVVGAGLLGYRLVGAANKPSFLEQSTSWAIALDALKESPLLGTGPSTFVSDFTRFRPASYNLTPNWATRFTTSNDFFLQVLATTGFLGFMAYIFLAARIYIVLGKTVRGASTSESALVRVLALAAVASAAIILTSQLFVPVSVTTLFLLFTFLIICTAALKVAGSSLVNEANIDLVAANATGHHSPLLPWIVLGLVLLLIIPGSYLTVRAYQGEVLLQTALNAAAINDGKKTYDTLLAAMRTNPYRDTYRVIYSQTNLLLANSIASKANLSDSERNTVTQLIQQSIAEAKNAVALNPVKVSNVENLASIYRNLLNLAQGADTWTIAAYQNAISLDPVNPNLRIALGGVFYSLKKYDDAVTSFTQATNLKPDLANGYFNLSAAYREKGDFDNAFTAMQRVVQLVDKNTPDYATASSQLEELRVKAGQKNPTPGSTDTTPGTLTTPAPLPSPIVSPIKLPEDLAPEAPATPSAQP